jgi:hypothetical protein
MTRRPSWPVAPVTTIMCLFLSDSMCLFLFDKVITTIVRPTDRQQILGSVLVEAKKASYPFCVQTARRHCKLLQTSHLNLSEIHQRRHSASCFQIQLVYLRLVARKVDRSLPRSCCLVPKATLRILLSNSRDTIRTGDQVTKTKTSSESKPLAPLKEFEAETHHLASTDADLEGAH